MKSLYDEIKELEVNIKHDVDDMDIVLTFDEIKEIYTDCRFIEVPIVCNNGYQLIRNTGPTESVRIFTNCPNGVIKHVLVHRRGLSVIQVNKSQEYLSNHFNWIFISDTYDINCKEELVIVHDESYITDITQVLSENIVLMTNSKVEDLLNNKVNNARFDIFKKYKNQIIELMLKCNNYGLISMIYDSVYYIHNIHYK